MQDAAQNQGKTAGPGRLVKVWDLPTRLFHWLLVGLIIASFVSGAIGGNAMQYHQWSGLAILVLLLFRLAWGFAGGHPSRFTSFLRGPKAVWRYARGLLRPDAPRHLGHNPLGGWSIIAMLAALSLQAGTGLFANDDILTEGPLYLWVSKSTSDLLTRIHLFNRQVLIVLAGLHVAAVIFYLVAKGENLVTPMITGVKHWDDDAAPSAAESPWKALLLAGLAAGAVYLLVR